MDGKEMITALAEGAIFRAVELKTSKAGRPFASASIKVKDGADKFVWVKVIAFSESVIAELERLGDGDHVSVQGGMKVETYDKDGETKIGFTIFADAVLALRQPPKAKKPKPVVTPEPPAPPPKAVRPAREPGDLDRYQSVGDPDLNDEICF
jgi:hypothetical protein